MKWITPKHSKEKVKKAGASLIKEDVKSVEFQQAIPIFHNWRSAHAFPMQIILDLLRKNAIRIDRNALVVQRLKRIPSIFNKLWREKGMSLSRMEDIAGCRAVLGNVRNSYRLKEALKNCRTKHTLHRERDYIETPKPSGYRGIHLIYRYKGSKVEYHGLSVEVQIRSKIQHSWATAVEVVGAFTKQALKASYGDDDWLNFFKYASAEFAKLENCKVEGSMASLDTQALLMKSSSELDVLKRLSAYRVTADKLNDKKEKGAGYFVLLLNLDKRIISINRYGKGDLKNATDFYDEKEQEYSNNELMDVVMVSASSLRDLKKAYPNYFLDTAEFEKNLVKALGSEKINS